MPTAIESGRAPLDGASTLRDLGGHRRGVGPAVRPGVVFGAGALGALTDADRARLGALGVGSTFDLRSDHERRTETPAPHLRTIHVGLPPPSPGDGGPAGRARYYERLLVGCSGSIGSVLLAIAHGGDAPSVIHCRDGVDRAGIVAAVLLLALEVDESVVLDEHELAARAAARPDGQSVRAALARALAALRRRYGTIEHYLVFAAGMTTDDVLALRLRVRSV